MKKFITLSLFFCIILLSGCSHESEIGIVKLDNYVYSSKMVFDTDEYNETWKMMNTGSIEQRYHVEDRKLGISLDYLFTFYSGEQSNFQVYRAT
jgi:hypothetical protein